MGGCSAKHGIMLLLVFLVCTVAIENPFLELSQKMSQVYKDPQSVTTKDLMDAANEYLCHLVRLRMEVTVNKTIPYSSADLLKEVYLEGNPPFHLRNIPWDKFVKYLNWTDTQITTYEDVISSTRRIWRECLEQLERYKEPDVIL